MSEGHRLIQLDGQSEAFRAEQALMSVTIKEKHTGILSNTDIYIYRYKKRKLRPGDTTGSTTATVLTSASSDQTPEPDSELKNGGRGDLKVNDDTPPDRDGASPPSAGTSGT